MERQQSSGTRLHYDQENDQSVVVSYCQKTVYTESGGNIPGGC